MIKSINFDEMIFFIGIQFIEFNVVNSIMEK